MASFPDYYDILHAQGCLNEDIRQAYRRESLKTHPDRLFSASTAEKQAATERFQAVADAYYVLSDPQRRSEYDKLSANRSSSERTSDPNASQNFFTTFASMFSSTSGGLRPNANHVFGDVFEDLLRPEVERHLPLWTWLGAACGAGLGFITANVPGLVVGAYAGNRLGAIRDAKGKSVAAVFSELGGHSEQRCAEMIRHAHILRVLALKVLGAPFT
ncbi:hypothetical protein BGW80DRAFT_1433829 [Lactifluus volemus]|nr:hypothetical protein BGW80DRAFT_1433829 [Lactifluus volemus]